MDNKLFFILGSPRSGTTLLRLMLNAHSEICVPPEAGFVSWLSSEYYALDFSSTDNVDQFINSLSKIRKIETWGIDFKKLSEFCYASNVVSYGDICRAVYAYYATTKGKRAKLCGDKNNFYVDFVAEINKLDIVDSYVVIVRDGRDVACSYLDLMSRDIDSVYAPDLSTNIENIASKWSDDVSTLLNFKDNNVNKVCLLKYEDLVLKPKEVLERVFGFLDVQYEESVNDFYKKAEHDEPTDFLQWKENISKPVFTDSVGRYRKILSKEQIAVFSDLAGEALVSLGYEH